MSGNRTTSINMNEGSNLNAKEQEEQYILVLDVGSTTVKCFIFDKDTNIRGQEVTSIRLNYPQPGWVEMDPDSVWENVVHVIAGALQNASISPTQLRCMALTTQRASFLFWDANNNSPLTPIISWKDARASSLVSRWNSSLSLKSFRWVCRALYLLTKRPRYLAGSVLCLMNELVVGRLLWVLDSVSNLRSKIALNQIKYGTLDTWLLHRLTEGEVHVTDPSSACVTGFYDPFTLTWAGWALKLYKIPSSILPSLVPSCGRHFGSCRGIWGRGYKGVEVPILASIADQSASLYGSGGWEKGSVKVTLGTGAFLGLSTGSKPYSRGILRGIYPLVGWKYGEHLVYICEGQSKDNGNLIEWGKRIGLYASVEESSGIAASLGDEEMKDGPYFVPSFNGLQAPYNDPKATCGFLGLTPTTTKAHLTRALLESLAFRVQQLLNILQTEGAGRTGDNDEDEIEFDHIKVDGGVSNNDFILQTLADLSGKPIVRPICRDRTALGVGFMAGVNCGFWKCKEELGTKYYKVERVFHPQNNNDKINHRFAEWERALERFLKWNKE